MITKLHYLFIKYSVVETISVNQDERKRQEIIHVKNEHKLGFLNLIVDAVSKQGRRPFGNNFIQFSSLSFVNRVSKITTDSKYNHL